MSAPEQEEPASGIVLYQKEDGRTHIERRFEGDAIWWTQALRAELFQTTPQNVTTHLKAIFAEGEISEPATCKESLQARREGKHEVTRARGLPVQRQTKKGQGGAR